MLTALPHAPAVLLLPPSTDCDALAREIEAALRSAIATERQRWFASAEGAADVEAAAVALGHGPLRSALELDEGDAGAVAAAATWRSATSTRWDSALEHSLGMAVTAYETVRGDMPWLAAVRPWLHLARPPAPSLVRVGIAGPCDRRRCRR